MTASAVTNMGADMLEASNSKELIAGAQEFTYVCGVVHLVRR
jgi:hypothetical protein